jgi:hypothetical protein
MSAYVRRSCSHVYSSVERNACVIEKGLAKTPDLFVLKSNGTAKWDIWKHFVLLFEKRRMKAATTIWRLL